MKIETINDNEELIKEIKKIGPISTISLTLTESEIKKWKRKGFFEHIKRELTKIDIAEVLKFACTSGLYWEGHNRIVSGRTYIFLCPTIEFANILVSMLKRLDKEEMVSITECFEFKNEPEITSIGEIANCALFS
jgi:hypothetical protein